MVMDMDGSPHNLRSGTTIATAPRPRDAMMQLLKGSELVMARAEINDPAGRHPGLAKPMTIEMGLSDGWAVGREQLRSLLGDAVRCALEAARYLA